MDEKTFQGTLDIKWENSQLIYIVWFLKPMHVKT